MSPAEDKPEAGFTGKRPYTAPRCPTPYPKQPAHMRRHGRAREEVGPLNLGYLDSDSEVDEQEQEEEEEVLVTQHMAWQAQEVERGRPALALMACGLHTLACPPGELQGGLCLQQGPQRQQAQAWEATEHSLPQAELQQQQQAAKAALAASISTAVLWPVAAPREPVAGSAEESGAAPQAGAAESGSRASVLQAAEVAEGKAGDMGEDGPAALPEQSESDEPLNLDLHLDMAADARANSGGSGPPGGAHVKAASPAPGVIELTSSEEEAATAPSPPRAPTPPNPTSPDAQPEAGQQERRGD